MHIVFHLLGVHDQQVLAVELQGVIGALTAAAGAVDDEFVIGDGQAFIGGVPVEVFE
ncbi:MAG: hypothetical protein NTZ12_08820 [Candidatus Aminicenantes bacterium]|nr:hypothetical protein [Candidatus Aminicenantes bacterium]